MSFSEHTTNYFFILLLVDIWVVSSFQSLKIIMLWKYFIHIFWCIKIWISVGDILRKELMGRVCITLPLVVNTKQFSKVILYTFSYLYYQHNQGTCRNTNSQVPLQISWIRNSEWSPAIFVLTSPLGYSDINSSVVVLKFHCTLELLWDLKKYQHIFLCSRYSNSLGMGYYLHIRTEKVVLSLSFQIKITRVSYW